VNLHQDTKTRLIVLIPLNSVKSILNTKNTSHYQPMSPIMGTKCCQ